MKVNLELDLTPEEMRRLIGLPDVSPVNDMLVTKLQEQVELGLEGKLLQTWMRNLVSGGTQSVEAYQKIFGDLMRRSRQGSADATADPDGSNPPPS